MGRLRAASMLNLCWSVLFVTMRTFVLIFATNTLPNSLGNSDLKSIERQNALDAMFLAPREAKSFIRATKTRFKRGWIQKITGEEEEEEEDAERRRRAAAAAARARYLNRICPSQCWGPWGPYGRCSVFCGSSGIQKSFRYPRPSKQCVAWKNKHGRCPGVGMRSKHCGRFCYNGGQLKSTSCVCKTGFIGRCCQIQVNCFYPGKPTNGKLSMVGRGYYYKAIAKYSCEPGYRLVGNNVRQCQSNGKWSNALPTCKEISCGKPPCPANGDVKGTVFTFGQTAVYSCKDGYRLEGSGVRKCLANGKWSPPETICKIITCSKVAAPAGGWAKTPHGVTFNKVAQFGCNRGFYMRGSTRRACQPDGEWGGTQPQCHPIVCSKLGAPVNGFVSHNNPNAITYGGKARFSCKLGYVLRGNAERVCTANGEHGVWTGKQPTCRAVNCGSPAAPSNGAVHGGSHSYPNSVTFTCHPGYYMAGPNRITCQSNGKWTAGKPTCRPCPVNQFKVGSNTATKCVPCPANSRTVTLASKSQKHCVCKTGYRGPAGGPCGRVKCKKLSAPAHGTVAGCQNVVGDTCFFSCAHGYIRNQGDEKRQCKANGQWSGIQPTCLACGRNTYKASETLCKGCPGRSHTTSVGNQISGCICDRGFQGPRGGPCTDVDECANRNGGCEQECINTVGGHRCDCNIPGFKRNPKDLKKCLVTRKCTPLRPPANGGLVCVLERITNTDRCKVKCNNGYEHLLRTNIFDECGPNTNWIWTHQTTETPIFYCVERFFEGVTLNAKVAYFVSLCDRLTDLQKKQVKEQFLKMLHTAGICRQGTKAVCDLQNVRIKCGKTNGRRKRGIKPKSPSELRVEFQIKVDQIAEKSAKCATYCAALRISTQNCPKACAAYYSNKGKAVLQQAKSQVEGLFKGKVTVKTVWIPRSRSGWYRKVGPRPKPTYPSGTRVVNWNENLGNMWNRKIPALRIGNRLLLPMTGIAAKAPHTVCAKGMVHKNGVCEPCPAGTYKPSDISRDCVVCPKGTYQSRPQQSKCLPCKKNTGVSGSSSC